MAIDLNAANIDWEKMNMLKAQQQSEMYGNIINVIANVLKNKQIKKDVESLTQEMGKRREAGENIEENYTIDPETGSIKRSYSISTPDDYKKTMVDYLQAKSAEMRQPGLGQSMSIAPLAARETIPAPRPENALLNMFNPFVGGRNPVTQGTGGTYPFPLDPLSATMEWLNPKSPVRAYLKNFKKPASQLNQIQVNSPRQQAVNILRQNGYPITEENISALLQQME